MKTYVIPVALCLFFMACSSNKKLVQPANMGNEMSATSNLQTKKMLQTGIDFFAEGNQPSNWQLSINYDDTVRFTAEDGLALKCAYNQLKKEFLPDKTIYSVKLIAGDVVINILEKTCTVPTIREVFTKEVTVKFNSIIYTGCGKFLADDNLNHKWVLEKIGNTFINKTDYGKLPMLEFDVVAGKVSGNDGCNNFGGRIEVQGKRIQFSQLMSTRMSCTKKGIEKIIREQISGKIISYLFKDNKLYLYLPDDSLMIFTKAIN